MREKLIALYNLFRAAISQTNNALNVNIVGGAAVLEVNLDEANDGVQIFGITPAAALVGVSVDAAGHTQADVLTSALPTGAATEGELDTQTGILTTMDADTGAIAVSAASIDGKITACNTGAAVLAAGEAQVGFVSSSGNVVTPAVVIDTALYAAGDVLFATTEIANFFRTSGGRALIHTISVLDLDEEAVAFDILFLDSSQSFGAANAVASLAEPITGMPILGMVSVSAGDYVDIGGQRLATLSSVGLTVQGNASTSVWIVGIVRGGPTYTAATDLRIKIGYIYM